MRTGLREPQGVQQQPAAHAGQHHGSLGLYSTGYALSILLTLIAFGLVNDHVQSGHHNFTYQAIIISIVCLAVIQLFVQLYFFLHLGSEKNPRWNLIIFSFMTMVVSIIVGGSLWIMQNLNDYMMSPHEMDSHMVEESQKGF